MAIMQKMAKNVGIFKAGLDFGEISGYAVDGTGVKIPMYSGMFGIKKERTASDAYVATGHTFLDNNCWVMQAPTATSATDDGIYVLIADETTSVEFNGQRHQNISRRTFGMEIPAGLPVRWYHLSREDMFELAEGNFLNAIGTNKYATLTAGEFYLTSSATAPTANGMYFKVGADSSRTANVGSADGGKLFMIDVAIKGSTIV